MKSSDKPLSRIKIQYELTRAARKLHGSFYRPQKVFRWLGRLSIVREKGTREGDKIIKFHGICPPEKVAFRNIVSVAEGLAPPFYFPIRGKIRLPTRNTPVMGECVGYEHLLIPSRRNAVRNVHK